MNVLTLRGPTTRWSVDKKREQLPGSKQIAPSLSLEVVNAPGIAAVEIPLCFGILGISVYRQGRYRKTRNRRSYSQKEDRQLCFRLKNDT